MSVRSFISGTLFGSAAATIGFVAHAGYARMDEGIGITHTADEIAQLRGESDLMRRLLLDRLKGMPTEVAEGIVTRLGILDFVKPDENYIVLGNPGGAGQLLIETRNGAVSDVLNYCWRVGNDCAIFEIYD